MVLPQIASFADAVSVEFSIGMLTFSRQFVAPFRMIAIFAHTTGVVYCLCVGTLVDFLP